MRYLSSSTRKSDDTYFSIGIHHKYPLTLNVACAGFCGGGEKERILKIVDFQDSSANLLSHCVVPLVL